MSLDFQERLADYVDELKLGIPLFNDTNIEDLSLSVAALPGGKTIVSYMDGAKDKQLNYEFQGKAKRETDRDQIFYALSDLAAKVEELEPNAIKSNNDSFQFINITVTSAPYLEGATTDGFIYFRLMIQATIKMFKERG